MLQESLIESYLLTPQKYGGWFKEVIFLTFVHHFYWRFFLMENVLAFL